MALTKTTSVETLDAWTNVPAGTLVVGADGDVSGAYSALLYILVALVEAVAQAGCTVIAECSYTGNDWVKFFEANGTAETPATTTINDAAVNAADTSLTLADATTGDFDIPGRLWYIKESTIANGEAVRVKSQAANVVTLCDALLRNHTNGANVYDRCDEWVVQVPMAAAYVRVLIYNSDSDADVDFTTRLSRVTAI
jgi:hypothetical protein